ncbi:MAG: aromatic amino acid lyase, partial [Desulfosalsimonas sp.]
SFSRSTESHNQDKVSMGTIAARDAKRICELAEKTVAICMLAGIQACELRGNLEQRTKLAELVSRLREIAPPTIADRPMDTDINSLSSAIADSGIFASAP